MHTFVRESKEGNYGVGRMVIVCSNTHDSHHEYEGMFSGLSLLTALRIVSILNGAKVALTDMEIKVLECFLVKG